MIILPHARGSLSSGDQLALDLQFAADKTLTARKGPTPVFTRASTATFVGSNGLIQSAAINAARFDHDPVTLASRGLLMEESRTNIVFPSDTLTTQTRTVTAVAHTLSFYGAGTVVLSGTHSATVVGAGAYPTRTTLTFTPTAGSLTLTVTGSVTQAQLEVGGFPTSYIPTTTASVVRSGDVCTISSTAFSNMWNRFAGSVVMRATNAGSNDSRWISTDVGQRTLDIAGKNSITFFEGAGGTTTVIGSSITLPATVGLAYEVNNYRSAYNGILGGVDTNTGGTLPNPTFLDIGRLNTLDQLCGCISFIRYYRKSLSNAKLVTLTT